jgi:hypothetical protein
MTHFVLLGYGEYKCDNEMYNLYKAGLKWLGRATRTDDTCKTITLSQTEGRIKKRRSILRWLDSVLTL